MESNSVWFDINIRRERERKKKEIERESLIASRITKND